VAVPRLYADPQRALPSRNRPPLLARIDNTRRCRYALLRARRQSDSCARVLVLLALQRHDWGTRCSLVHSPVRVKRCRVRGREKDVLSSLCNAAVLDVHSAIGVVGDAVVMGDDDGGGATSFHLVPDEADHLVAETAVQR